MTRDVASDLAATLRPIRCLLLDFDGPICAIFAGRAAADIAQELIEGLRDDGHSVPEDVEALADPFDVLRYAGRLSTPAAVRTDLRLRAAELEAARTATATPHAAQVIKAWRGTGRRVAAVSNNSEAAIAAYLERHGVELDLIVGRASADPALLKPNPHLVACALDALQAEPAESVFVGDSPSDIIAGRQASVATIGFANKPGKRPRLENAGACIVIDSLASLSLPSLLEQ